MAYDTQTAESIRRTLSDHENVVEKRMVGGGLSFMVGGKLCCGVSRTDLMVRVGPAAYKYALTQPYTRPLTLGGKSPLGYLYVDSPGFESDDALNAWIQQALAFVKTLTP